MVPAFHTFDIIEGNYENYNNFRNILLRDYDFNSYEKLISTLSLNPIENVMDSNITRYFDRVIVGLAKLEHDPS